MITNNTTHKSNALKQWEAPVIYTIEVVETELGPTLLGS
jgi:hypothetical protein